MKKYEWYCCVLEFHQSTQNQFWKKKKHFQKSCFWDTCRYLLCYCCFLVRLLFRSSFKLLAVGQTIRFYNKKNYLTPCEVKSHKNLNLILNRLNPVKNENLFFATKEQQKYICKKIKKFFWIKHVENICLAVKLIEWNFKFFNIWIV